MLADPDIHIVDICTPPPFHAEQAVAVDGTILGQLNSGRQATATAVSEASFS